MSEKNLGDGRSGFGAGLWDEKEFTPQEAEAYDKHIAERRSAKTSPETSTPVTESSPVAPTETPKNPIVTETPEAPRKGINSLEQHLLDNHEGYRSHADNFSRAEGAAGVDSRLKAGQSGSWELHPETEYAQAHKEITGTAQANKTAKIKLEGEEAKQFERMGARAETGLSGLAENHAKMRAAIDEAHQAKVGELKATYTADLKAAKGAKAQEAVANKYAKGLEELKAQKTELLEHHGHQGKAIETARTEIDAAAGSGRIPASKAAAAAGTDVAIKAGESYAMGTAGADKLGMIGEEALAAKGNWLNRAKAKFTANMNISEVKNGEAIASGGFAKGAKAALGAVGTLGVAKGAWDTVNYVIGKPKTDVEGKEVPRDGGDLVKGLVEMGAGSAALAYMLRTGKAVGR